MITLIAASLALSRFLVPDLEPADIPLRAPAGWKSSKDSGATILVPGELSQGKIFTVIITPLQTKAGTLDEVYEVGKQMMAQVGAYTAISKVTDAKSEGDWDYKFTIGKLEKDGNGLLAEVLAVKKGDVGGVVIVLSDSLETLQLYSDPFSQMIRTLGGAKKAPPAPEVASSGMVDLQYSVPSGWVETKKTGATVIEASKDDFYTKYRWTLVVMPSQPLKGSIRDNFKEYWKALVTANYESAVAPLPLLARLGDGSICAFDAEGSATHKTTGAKPQRVAVYLIAHGDRFVPILAIQYGYDRKLEDDVNHFIEAARIPGASTAKLPLFNRAEVVGNWSESSASIASYVTSSGSYAGDASIFTGSYFHLNGDGTYKYSFVGLSGSTRLKESSEGKWRIADNDLVLSDPKGGRTYSLLGYGTDEKGGRFLVLGTYSGVKAKVSFANPRGPLQASWFKAQ